MAKKFGRIVFEIYAFENGGGLCARLRGYFGIVGYKSDLMFEHRVVIAITTSCKSKTSGGGAYTKESILICTCIRPK